MSRFCVSTRGGAVRGLYPSREEAEADLQKCIYPGESIADVYVWGRSESDRPQHGPIELPPDQFANQRIGE